MASEPDGLILPPGFHATVVVENLGDQTRHMAFRDASRLYISTEQQEKDEPNLGVIALHLDARHHADKIEHFSTIDNGTAIAIYKGALYTASEHSLYRISISGDALVPTAQPEIAVDDVPGRSAVAFDDANGLYVAVGSSGNICAPKDTPRDAQTHGVTPCPILANKAGVWRFDARKTNHKFADGEHFATGIRDTNALAWSPDEKALYAVNYGRDNAEKAWPKLISAEESAHFSDEMFKVTQGTNMGWPYTYYDSVKHIRLLQPEYGGDGKAVVTDSKYAVPATAFPAHVAPMNIVFYEARQFPARYRGGAFIAFHGSFNCNPPGFEGGFNVMFVPMNKSGEAGTPEVFAGGFAGRTHEDQCRERAAYRPVDVAVGPDGALYVADSQKGRIWRIDYEGS
jgi:glucose/arabinose dehydrogenase